MNRDELLALAEHHTRQGVSHAKAAWYHGHETDTRRAAEHFTVAAALRALAAQEGEGER